MISRKRRKNSQKRARKKQWLKKKRNLLKSLLKHQKSRQKICRFFWFGWYFCSMERVQNVTFRRGREWERQKTESEVIYLIYHSAICVWYYRFSPLSADVGRRKMCRSAMGREWEKGKIRHFFLIFGRCLFFCGDISVFSYFRREVPARGICAGAICRK